MVELLKSGVQACCWPKRVQLVARTSPATCRREVGEEFRFRYAPVGHRHGPEPTCRLEVRAGESGDDLTSRHGWIGRDSDATPTSREGCWRIERDGRAPDRRKRRTRLRILVVEDNRNLVANLFEYFEARGQTLDAAPDGPSGLHLAVAHPSYASGRAAAEGLERQPAGMPQNFRSPQVADAIG